jgi:hypothetical protein
VNQVCQLMSISKKTYYHSQEPQERLAEKYQALRRCWVGSSKSTLAYYLSSYEL